MVNRGLIYCGDGTTKRTTEDDMRALPKALAPACLVALRNVLQDPTRIGTQEVAGPLRRYSAVSGQVWLYFAADDFHPAEPRFYLVLVRRFAAKGATPNQPDDDAALWRWEFACRA